MWVQTLFVHVFCGNRRTKSGHGLISSFEPRICSYCSRPLCAPLIEESLPRLVSAAPKGHSSLDSFISCISQVVPFTPWGISGPERSPFPTLGKLEVAVRSRSWQPLDLAVVFVSFASEARRSLHTLNRNLGRGRLQSMRLCSSSSCREKSSSLTRRICCWGDGQHCGKGGHY